MAGAVTPRAGPPGLTLAEAWPQAGWCWLCRAVPGRARRAWPTVLALSKAEPNVPMHVLLHKPLHTNNNQTSRIFHYARADHGLVHGP